MKFSWKNIENWRSPENDFCLVFWFLVFGYWVDQKKICFCFSVCKKPRRFIWGSIYSCTMDGFFRIFKKAVSELICTRLYFHHIFAGTPFTPYSTYLIIFFKESFHQKLYFLSFVTSKQISQAFLFSLWLRILIPSKNSFKKMIK